jgi:hypothetical protein
MGAAAIALVIFSRFRVSGISCAAIGIRHQPAALTSV